jgi:hypothetical protein
MKIFKTSLFLLLPFLAMTEGGAMFQRLVNIPYWLNDMSTMKSFYLVGKYFFVFTPPVVIIWLVMVVSSRNFKGKYRNLLFANHLFYFTIILSTAFYFIPTLGLYLGNEATQITLTDYAVMQTWAKWSLARQILGFIVLATYSFFLSKLNSTEK